MTPAQLHGVVPAHDLQFHRLRSGLQRDGFSPPAEDSRNSRRKRDLGLQTRARALDVDLRGIGGPFEDHVVTNVAPDAAATTLTLAPGKTYEWYADVNTCGSTTRTPLYRFTTMESARAARELGGALDQPVGRQRTKRVTSGPVDSEPDDPSLAD